ncbi:hypothetical protein EDB84DRAFT_1443774 [Lactarius hengduanensis]|nr:hypothetical protein EDB84DRAFT_1443774 [Lactarius hengduanensis]
MCTIPAVVAIPAAAATLAATPTPAAVAVATPRHPRCHCYCPPPLLLSPPITLSRSGPSPTSHHHHPPLPLSCCRRTATVIPIAVAITPLLPSPLLVASSDVFMVWGCGHGRRGPAAVVVGVAVVPAQLPSPHSPHHHPHRACCGLGIVLMHTPPLLHRRTGLGLPPPMMVVAAWSPHSTVGAGSGIGNGGGDDGVVVRMVSGRSSGRWGGGIGGQWSAMVVECEATAAVGRPGIDISMH